MFKYVEYFSSCIFSVVHWKVVQKTNRQNPTWRRSRLRQWIGGHYGHVLQLLLLVSCLAWRKQLAHGRTGWVPWWEDHTVSLKPFSIFNDFQYLKLMKIEILSIMMLIIIFLFGSSGCVAFWGKSPFNCCPKLRLAYTYMAASWGGYIFVLNMIGLHAGILTLWGSFRGNLYADARLLEAQTSQKLSQKLGKVEVVPILGRYAETCLKLLFFFTDRLCWNIGKIFWGLQPFLCGWNAGCHASTGGFVDATQIHGATGSLGPFPGTAVGSGANLSCFDDFEKCCVPSFSMGFHF